MIRIKSFLDSFEGRLQLLYELSSEMLDIIRNFKLCQQRGDYCDDCEFNEVCSDLESLVNWSKSYAVREIARQI